MNQKPTLQQKGRYGLQYRGTECRNCGHPLDISDRFCPNCSQANSNKKLTLGDFFNEFFASLISYDSRLLKTLSALLTKPGKITRDYIEGKRVSYTNPFRFLLSLSILYFLLINITTDYTSDDTEGNDATIYNYNYDSPYYEDNGIDSTLKSSSNDIKGNKLKVSLGANSEITKRDSIILADPVAHFNNVNEKSFNNRFEKKIAFFKLILDSTRISKFHAAQKKFKLTKSLENKAAFTLADNSIKIEKQPEAFLSSVVSKLPFAIFLLIPVFTLFVWLIYIRKKYTYTEHLVFGFHIQSLLFILLIISFLIDAIFGTFSTLIFFLIFAIYLFLALWKFYGQGFFKTIVKYVFLNTIFFILALFTIVLLFTGSLFTY